MSLIRQELKLYNSLTKEKENFEGVTTDHVGMYVCGPTVYNEVHLGNCRTYTSFDILYRYLKHLDYKVRYVRNITDVGHLVDDADEGEDKIGKIAKLNKLEPMEVAQKYTNSFRTMMSLLNNLPPSIEPTATGHIQEQIHLIEQIMEQGFAYESHGSVYFDVDAFHQKTGSYGNLSGRKIEDLIAESRALVGQQEKRNNIDFALWKKASDDHIMRWNSPWSWGFPGWHLECSAMSSKYLGDTFDIHGGGIDLKFPHHECEVAQSLSAGKPQPAKYWMHANMLTLNGEKMSKSKGNTVFPSELLAGTSQIIKGTFDPMTIRFYFLQSHYRGVMNITQEGIEAADKALLKIITAIEKLSKLSVKSNSDFDVDQWIQGCYEALNDDINTPRVIAQLFELVKFINQSEDSIALTANDLARLKTFVEILLKDILGLCIESTQKDKSKDIVDGLLDLISEVRDGARADKNWSISDLIRDKLCDLGIKIKDGKDRTHYEY